MGIDSIVCPLADKEDSQWDVLSLRHGVGNNPLINSVRSPPSQPRFRSHPQLALLTSLASYASSRPIAQFISSSSPIAIMIAQLTHIPSPYVMPPGSRTLLDGWDDLLGIAYTSISDPSHPHSGKGCSCWDGFLASMVVISLASQGSSTLRAVLPSNSSAG